ncbi:uncharacterized protein LOC120332047 [Styela clava]
MSSRCAVGGCYNSARDGVSLHRFPHSIVKCLQWFNFVQKSRTNFELDLVSGAYICSQHFDEKCFVSPDETQNKAAQRKLTEGAIPTIMGTISAQEGVKNRKVIKDHKLLVNRRSSARIVGDNRVKRTKLPILKHRKVIRDDIISDTYSSSEDTVSSHCDKRDQTLSSSENSVSNQGDERNQTHSSSEDSFSNHCDKRDQTFSARADIVCDRHIKNEINDQVHLPKIKEIKEEIPESKDENDSEETAESTGVAKFSCLRCNQDFSSVVEWTQHMTTHTHGHTDTTESEPETKKPKKRTFKPKFKCAVCGKEFQYPSRYEQHIMIHTGEKPYFCKECGKAFTHPSCLTRHMVTHTGEKPFSCEKCKQRFSLQTSLRRHVRTHTGEKPYKCVPCGKSFTQMYSLHRHRLAHNGEKPFGCHLCKKRFTQQCALTSHLRMKFRFFHYRYYHVSMITISSRKTVLKYASQSDWEQTFVDNNFEHNFQSECEEKSGQMSSSIMRTRSSFSIKTEIDSCYCESSVQPGSMSLMSVWNKTLLDVEQAIDLRKQTKEKPSTCEESGKIDTCKSNIIEPKAQAFDLRKKTIEKAIPSIKSEIQRESTYSSRLRSNRQNEKPLTCEESGKINISKSNINEPRAQAIDMRKKTIVKVIQRKSKCSWKLRSNNQNEKPLTCEESGKVYICKSNINVPKVKAKKPRKRSLQPPKFMCDACGKLFQFWSVFEQHIMIHTGEKPHICIECGKAFTDPSCLRRHMIIHTGLKPFSCKTCGRCFTLRTTLQRHMQTHTGERPFLCEPCGKYFTRMYCVRRHKLSHNGARLFGCHLCEKRFSQKSARTAHLRMKHCDLYRAATTFSEPSFALLYFVMKRGDGVERMYLNWNSDIVNFNTYAIVPTLVYVCKICPVSNNIFTPMITIVLFYWFQPVYYLVICHTHGFFQIQTISSRTTLGTKMDSQPDTENDESFNNTEQSYNSRFSCLQCDTDFASQSEWKQHLLAHIYDKNFEPDFNRHTSEENSDQNSSQTLRIRVSDTPKVKSEHSSNSPEQSIYKMPIWNENMNDINKAVGMEEESVEQEKQSSENPFPCSLCGNQFKNKYSLRSHMVNHHKEKQFTCKECGKIYTCQSSMYKHVKTHYRKTRYSCTKCEMLFSIKEDLQTHMVTHKGEKPFKCDKCGKSFVGAYALQRHNVTHTGERPHVCEHCGNTYTQKCSLTAHIQVHTGIKPYKCEECGKYFTRQCHLHVHKRIHTGVKPYKCKHCDKSFTDYSGLSKHIRKHTGEKPFACTECSKHFSQQSTLKEHLRTTHFGYKPYKCPDCDKSFTRQPHLRTHIRTRHEKLGDIRI